MVVATVDLDEVSSYRGAGELLLFAIALPLNEVDFPVLHA